MWHIGTFKPVTLFSLRPANATVSGGKTLVTPTPFALKMAMLDATIRTLGRERGIEWWETLRDLEVAVSLPQNLLVVKSFQRILRPKDKAEQAEDRLGTGLFGVWKSNIVYREYVHYDADDEIHFAVQAHTDLPFEWLFSQINYLGKRGGFFQFIEYDGVPNLPNEFVLLTQPTQAFQINGLMQLLDDCGNQMTFAHADVFDEKQTSLKIQQPKGRLLNMVILPYQQVRAGRNFTAYQRIQTHG